MVQDGTVTALMNSELYPINSPRRNSTNRAPVGLFQERHTSEPGERPEQAVQAGPSTSAPDIKPQLEAAGSVPGV